MAPQCLSGEWFCSAKNLVNFFFCFVRSCWLGKRHFIHFTSLVLTPIMGQKENHQRCFSRTSSKSFIINYEKLYVHAMPFHSFCVLIQTMAAKIYLQQVIPMLYMITHMKMVTVLIVVMVHLITTKRHRQKGLGILDHVRV